ncbi:hypothetical protein MKY84_08225 [Chryseomicrobium sp. FSL W7-1435]|uniref:hypothetical protein n=1 Tax=Chryseomicrobium sp. FSL W7-1435 TaxID=2921704 RepID=UPI00315A6049
MTERGFSTVEALAAFSCVIVIIASTVPLIDQLNERMDKSQADYHAALAEYELLRQLPNEATITLGGSSYTSYWKEGQWCLANRGVELKCLITSH